MLERILAKISTMIENELDNIDEDITYYGDYSAISPLVEEYKSDKQKLVGLLEYVRNMEK